MAASRMLQGIDLRRAGVLALLLVLWLTVSSTAMAAVPSDRATTLERRLGTPADAVVHRDTGRVRFVGTPPRRPLARPRGVPAGAAPATVARAFLEAYGTSFGIPDQERQLDVGATADGPRGGSVVRFEQVQDGVPVLGGELVVNLDGDGRVRSAGGEAIPAGDLASLDMRPSVASADAVDTARAVVARAHGVSAADLQAAPAELQIYDARLFGGSGPQRPTLVWRTEVTGGVAGEIRELVLVDAQLGSVALHFNQAADVKQRTVCDGGNVRGAGLPCVSPVRSEGDGPHAVTDVNLAYDYAGDTYDFFFDRFGRDSLDDAGMPLRSTVRYCTTSSSDRCPYPNAFWNGEQMVYGDGFSAADDVVGHELTHGVTEFSSHLFYWYQSGAINESLSDIFGELVDLANRAGNDDPSVRWEMGEDVPGFGTLRDMANPPRFGDPDRMTSPNYFADVNEDDNGGVHWNSGVGNKAAYLLTDGDTFNGETVVGLGEDKVAQIFYTASTTMLTSASDYADLAIALRQACANLVGSHGIVSADCEQVDATIRAVEMEADPPAAPAPEAPVCNAGPALTTAYLDDFENPASGRWTVSALTGRAEWYYAQTQPYGGFDATYARSGVGNLWGYDRAGTGDYAMAMNGDVVVPAGGRMRFEHAFWFDDDVKGASDGGALEYSLNGGGSWSDAGPLISENGYNGSIARGFENPLARDADRVGFVRESNGYRSTRLDLRALVGQSIRFRFRIGTDSFPDADDYGWFIDNVRIYGCEADPDPPPSDPPPSDPPPAVTPPPAQGSTTPPTGDEEPDEPAAHARAAVVRKRVVVRRGRVRLVLRCKAEGVDRCRGTVLIGRRGSLGRRGFRIEAGRRGAVVVKLSRRARRALARRGAIRLAVTVRTRVPGASTATARARVTAILRA